MENLTLIAAIGKNNELGLNNALIWYLPDDLKFFKEKTQGKTIVMGYNTFMSLPKLLPNRRHLVLTKKDIKIDGVEIFNSKEALLEEVKKIKEEVFVIGGASIYELFLNDVSKMYLTEIDKEEKKADTFFPKFNKEEWEQIFLKENENNNIKFKHMEYRKINNMQGKLIVVEGTDCSGKETQTKKLIEKLIADGHQVMQYGFPDYDTPTGKIIGGPYLGKSHISEGWFPEGASNVDAKVAAAYFIADRKYNEWKIIEALNKGINVVLDRYTYSNMAHQGGKIFDDTKRKEMYNFIDTLEFGLYNLVKPDIKIFLHMPLEAANILKQGRDEKPDQHEMNEEHLKCAEKAYIEIASLYDFKTIECSNKMTNVSKDDIKSINDINDEIYNYVKTLLTEKQKRR